MIEVSSPPTNEASTVHEAPPVHNRFDMAPQTLRFYRNVLNLLNQASIPYLVGGTYALNFHTGLNRHTKDFDIFIDRADFHRIADVLAQAGYKTIMTYPHWLAKTFCDNDFVDLVFNSGNGVAEVDGEWFEHAVDGEIFGIPTRICPAEEMIWSKAFIMERERFDGADVAHLLHAAGSKMHWTRLLRRFEPHWQLLLSHLILFRFIYPTSRKNIPLWVMEDLQARLHEDLKTPTPEDKVCVGTLLSREQYLSDIDTWEYQDARLSPLGKMSPEEAEKWTDAIKKSH
jgi:hypothetical protein